MYGTNVTCLLSASRTIVNYFTVHNFSHQDQYPTDQTETETGDGSQTEPAEQNGDNSNRTDYSRYKIRKKEEPLCHRDPQKCEEEFKARLLVLMMSADSADEISIALDLLGPPPMPLACNTPTVKVLLSGICCPFEPFLRTFLCKLL